MINIQMTAVANPPSFQQINRSAWGANGGQGSLNSINPDEVARMFMPRKSAQRANSSSSISSNSTSSSSTTTIQQPSPQTNGISMPATGDPGWNTALARKKPQRAGPWPPNKSEPISTAATARSQSILGTNGTSTGSSMSSLQQPQSVVPSQHLMQTSSQQQNGGRQTAPTTGEGNPVLYLLSMNGTFERKTIQVPFYPDSLRIGRQTNAKTVPTPSNGFFDSKVLSRQHAEIWADRNGKIWIRDVRSSNGTFVNGARLSAENRDSEPHELQTQDHLELGIDIVSEDQKTVVHHKVAAKVEHAGFLGPTTNVLDMNFGDLDPANGSLMLPSQNGMQMRGRTNSQGSVGSGGRFGPPSSITTTNMGSTQQRPMNFWLTPITTEQIVKRLTHEMRSARLQTADLNRTEQFFDTLLSKEDFKEVEKSSINEIIKHPQVNGGSLSFKMDGKPRFSDPPAPPPQQPLPEKPDIARPHTFDPASPLKRSNTERPKSVPNASPDRHEPTGRIMSLLEALATAHKEIEAQNARMRDLEDLLKKEREAREVAEAKSSELESCTKMDGFAKGGMEGSVIEAAFEPPAEIVTENTDPGSSVTQELSTTAVAVEASTTKLHERIELMMMEMRDMKEQMEAYRQRAEKAEAERDVDRKTLTEMVEKIRSEEQARRSTSTERGRSRSKAKRLASKPSSNAKEAGSIEDTPDHESEFANGKVTGRPVDAMEPKTSLAVALSQPPGAHDRLLYHSTPYASMLGVVLLGMGLMAYMNNWQKVER